MRCGLALVMAVIWIGMMCFSAYGEERQDEQFREQLEASGAEELKDAVPEDGMEVLCGWKVDAFTAEGMLKLQPKEVLSGLAAVAKEQAKNPWRCMRSILAILLLGALLRAMISSFGEQEYHRIFLIVSLLAAQLSVVLPLSEVIRQVGETIRQVCDFLAVLIPTMAGIMAVNGNGFAASGYTYSVLTAAEVIAAVTIKVILPFVYLLFALSITTSLTARTTIGNLAAFLQKSARWILVFAMSFFLGLLSLKSIVGSAADNLSIKMLKFIIGSSVPIVGGIVNEALNTVRGSLSLLKTTTGAFGILAGIAILVPSFVQIVLWKCCLWICAAVSDSLEQKEMSQLLHTVSEILGLVLAVLLCGCILLIVSVGILLAMGNGMK